MVLWLSVYYAGCPARTNVLDVVWRGDAEKAGGRPLKSEIVAHLCLTVPAPFVLALDVMSWLVTRARIGTHTGT